MKMTREEKLEVATKKWHECEHNVEITSMAHKLALDDLHNAQRVLKEVQDNATDDTD